MKEGRKDGRKEHTQIELDKLTIKPIYVYIKKIYIQLGNINRNGLV